MQRLQKSGGQRRWPHHGWFAHGWWLADILPGFGQRNCQFPAKGVVINLCAVAGSAFKGEMWMRHFMVDSRLDFGWARPLALDFGYRQACLHVCHGPDATQGLKQANEVQVFVIGMAHFEVQRRFVDVLKIDERLVKKWKTDPKTGKPFFEELWDEVAPDFLSGTTHKTRSYTRDPYYRNLFKHFKINLQKSELLFVVGYGFQDGGINKYLEKYFLSRGKHMVVIDPNKPKTDLLEKYNASYIQKGVTDVSFQEYLSRIPDEISTRLSN